jgi:hypothetical protein
MSSKKRERLLSDKTKASLKRKPVMMGDVEVYAWELTSKQKTTLEASNMNSKGEADPEKFSDYRSRVLIVGVRDSGEDGAPRTFEDGDEMYLADLPASVVEEAYLAVLDLSGLTKDAQEALKKNSTTSTAGSSTASHSNGAGPTPKASLTK